MTIKILTLSGGGPNGITTLGIIKKLQDAQHININNIEKIYATSSGAILGVLIALKFDVDTIIDYIIQRPWHETYKIKIEDILASYLKKGIFDKSSVEKFYLPFFNARDLNINMTMKEFYEYSKIELHFFSQEINHYTTTDISYKTFPDITLIETVHMSCAIPFLFTPVIINDKCYIDGGCESNYPINFCIEDNNNNLDEILGICNSYTYEKNNNYLNNDSTILDFIINLFYKLFSNNIFKDKNIKLIPNEIIYKNEPLTLSFMSNMLYSSENRQQLLEYGFQIANDYISKSHY